jgi:hypothetical protein
MRLKSAQALQGSCVVSFQDPHVAATSPSFPEYEGKGAGKNVHLRAIFALMPDRAHAQFLLLDARGRAGSRP